MSRLPLIGIALALSAIQPAWAASHGTHPGYDARAEATGFGAMRGGRDEALHDCNKSVAPKVQYTWGDQQTQMYRACMARHGQSG